MRKEIKLLDDALDMLSDLHGLAFQHSDELGRKCIALMDEIEACVLGLPEQEPDAWLSGGGLELKQVLVKQNGEWTETPFIIGKPWVSLTDADIASLENIHETHGLSVGTVARIADTLLKDRNT